MEQRMHSPDPCRVGISNGNQYFGTMAGIRGFNDPNVQVNPDGLPVWFQCAMT